MSTYLQIGYSILFSILVLTACKTQQYTYDSYDGKRMAIGSSGGFTGATSKYVIFENGQLFQKNGNDYQELPSLNKNLAKQQFDNYYTLGFDQLDINESGNINYFIIMNPDSEDVKMLKWGGGANQPTQELEQFYDLLSAIIRKNNTPNQ